MTRLQALIFDVDGTIAETERDGHRLAFNRAFQDAGLDWKWSVPLYGQLLAVSGGKERIGFYLQHYQPNFVPPTDLDAFIAQLHSAKTQHFKKIVAEGSISLRPGVKRLLEEARSENLRLAIATTATLDNVLALLKYSLGKESISWFEIIAAGDIVPAKKPAPDIYFYVLEKMQLKPSECLVFEDSQHGLEAALQANLPTIITMNDYTRDQEFSGASLVLNHLGEENNPLEIVMGEKTNAKYFDLNTIQKLHETLSTCEQSG